MCYYIIKGLTIQDADAARSAVRAWEEPAPAADAAAINARIAADAARLQAREQAARERARRAHAQHDAAARHGPAEDVRGHGRGPMRSSCRPPAAGTSPAQQPALACRRAARLAP